MFPPSSGTGQFAANTRTIIRFVRKGCANRPFYHIVVADRRTQQHEPVIEQLGSYDPLVNEHNERLVALNFERIRHWIGNGADVTLPVLQLLGLSGFFPIHPTSYMTAWRNRRAAAEEAVKKKEEESRKSEQDS